MTVVPTYFLKNRALVRHSFPNPNRPQCEKHNLPLAPPWCGELRQAKHTVPWPSYQWIWMWFNSGEKKQTESLYFALFLSKSQTKNQLVHRRLCPALYFSNNFSPFANLGPINYTKWQLSLAWKTGLVRQRKLCQGDPLCLPFSQHPSVWPK